MELSLEDKEKSSPKYSIKWDQVACKICVWEKKYTGLGSGAVHGAVTVLCRFKKYAKMLLKTRGF